MSKKQRKRGLELKGYTLKSENYIDLYKAHAYYYTHDATGAELFYIAADDANKVFSVGFSTVPSDDTGVAHIVEHCVLCGSKKYPLKELFGTLAKTSLSTYLNAMTFSDKTLYPLASQNDKDFFNLVDAYLDAVFNPTMYDDELFFRQEGHNFNFEGEGAPVPSGVVYNEMKGAMSDPDAIAGDIANRKLFTNTYQYNSGGDPDVVLDLSYDDFIAFHKKHYHPSNARFFVYGDVDIEALTEVVESCIGRFDRGERIPEPVVDFGGGAGLVGFPQYASGEYLSSEDAGIAVLKFVLGESYDRGLCLSAGALSRCIFENEASPLRKNLIESGFCDDLSAYMDDSSVAAALSVTLYGVRENAPEKIEARVFEELAKVEAGYLTKSLTAEISRMKFELLENDFGTYPKGMTLMYRILLHTREVDDPFSTLSVDKIVESVEAAVQSGEHTSWIAGMLLENPYRAAVYLHPKADIAEKDQSYRWLELTPAQREMEKSWYDRLRKQQDSPDSEEALAALPKIGLEDVPRENKKRDAVEDCLAIGEREGEDTVKLLYYSMDTRVVYAKLFFPFGELSQEELSQYSCVLFMLGNAGTKNHTLEEIVYQIKMYSGGIKFGMYFADGRSFITVTVKSLPEYFGKNLALVEDILKNTRFDDTKRLRELMKQGYTRMQQAFVNSGDVFAIEQTLAKISADERNGYFCEGLGYYKWLKGALGMDQAALSETVNLVSDGFAKIVSADNAVVSLGSDEENLTNAKAELSGFLAKLPRAQKTAYKKSALLLDSPSGGFAVPAGVNFVARCFKIPEPNGVHLALKAFLFSEFLWPEIRMKGGAYGANCAITRHGGFVLSSYRDPNLRRTLEQFAGVGDYVLGRGIAPMELEAAKLGALSSMDAPVGPSREFFSAIDRYFQGVSAEKLHIERTQAYDATVDDLLGAAGELQKFASSGHYFVVGGEAGINENKDLFVAIEKMGV